MCGSTAYEGSTPPTFALALIPSDIRSLSKSGSFWGQDKIIAFWEFYSTYDGLKFNPLRSLIRTFRYLCFNSFSKAWRERYLPHPGVICEAKVFGECHQHSAPHAVLKKRTFLCNFENRVFYHWQNRFYHLAPILANW